MSVTSLGRASPTRRMSFSADDTGVSPILSGMRTLFAGISTISFVKRSMLMYEGRNSPVLSSATLTILPRFPVCFRLFLSSSVKE